MSKSNNDNIFQVTIELGNSGMLYPEDVAIALRKVAEQLDQKEQVNDWEFNRKIRDVNGNSVGFAETIR